MGIAKFCFWGVIICWTAAAVLLAYDALHDITSAGRLFSDA